MLIGSRKDGLPNGRGFANFAHATESATAQVGGITGAPATVNIPSRNRSNSATSHARRVKTLATITAAAVVVASLALFFGIITYSRAEMLVQKATHDSQSVLVVSQAIQAGESFSSENISVVSVPATYRVEGALVSANIAEVEGKVALSPLSPGTQITATNVSGFTGSHLAAAISAGMEALTLAVDEESGLAGHIQMYDLVRVISVAASSDSEVYAQTVCDRAKVVSVGLASDSAATAYSSVTLEVSPEVADEIRKAQQVGEVSVVLISEEDGLDG